MEESEKGCESIVMNFVEIKLGLHGYSFERASSIEMTHLGYFLIDDVGDDGSFFKDWVLESTDRDTVGGNYSVLEREMDDILLWDEYPIAPTPTKLRMTVEQFLHIFDEWQEKVVKLRPKDVVIKYEHGRFFIETSDD